MDAFAATVTGSLIVLALVASFLGIQLLRQARAKNSLAHGFWGSGVILVSVTLAMEAFLFAGFWSQPLIQSYFFLVAILVGLLALGSLQGILSVRSRDAFYGYFGVTAGIMAVFSFATPVSSAVITDGVVTGNPPLEVLVLSILITVPATALMLYTSIWGAFKTHRWRLLLIAAGILVITAAGALYVVSVPVTLYYAEFIGVVLLFLGFVRLPSPRPAPVPRSTPGGS